MKKILSWVQWISFTVLLIDWTIIGLKLLDGKHDFVPAAYVALVCWVVFCICLILRIFTCKCPYCGKPRLTRGEYCSHCGKKIAE